jgi:hexosaminidase
MRAVVLALAAGLIVSSCAKAPPRSRPPAPAPNVGSSVHQVIPQPTTIESLPGDGFSITADTIVVVTPGDDRLLWVARYLGDLIGLAAAPRPPRIEAAGAVIPRGAISLELDPAVAGPESYELTVTPERVTIRASQAAGMFYGVQSFRQLLPAFVEYDAVRPDKTRPVVAAATRIADRPRFAWRGAMLDVARHFLSVAEVKRFVDLMVIYKLNRLHLHLADDQGWRVEIRAWPNLTAYGGSTEVGGGAGCYYTQAEYADLVDYASRRFVTLVPEIDMPCHTNAALASYAELNCDGKARQLYTGIEVGFSSLCVEKERTYAFISDVVREIAAMTPGPWFHVGGDEVKTLTPRQYTGFVERVQAIVQSHGKHMIGWDEVSASRLSPTSIVQMWRPRAAATEAVAQGVKVIMSVANRAYLDMKYDRDTAIGLTWAALISVQAAYEWDPVGVYSGVPESAVLGVEAPLWSETIANIRDVEYLAFPRLIAIAELGWSEANTRDWSAFRERLGAHGPRLTALGVNYHRAPDVPWR